MLSRRFITLFHTETDICVQYKLLGVKFFIECAMHTERKKVLNVSVAKLFALEFFKRKIIAIENSDVLFFPLFFFAISRTEGEFQYFLLCPHNCTLIRQNIKYAVYSAATVITAVKWKISRLTGARVPLRTI